MSRYAPGRYRTKKRKRPALPALELTGNFRALDRPLLRGARTPLQWPPIAWSWVVA